MIKVVNSCEVTCHITMIINWGGHLEMFFDLLPKCSFRFTNVLFITFKPGTLVSVNHSTFLHYSIFVLESHKEVFNGSTNFKMRLLQMLLRVSLRPLCMAQRCVYSLFGVCPVVLLVLLCEGLF